MKRTIIIPLMCALLLSGQASFAAGHETEALWQDSVGLEEAIGLALKNNERLKAAQAQVEAEGFSVLSAKSERYPSVYLNGGVTRSRYPQPIRPISGSPLKGTDFPDFDETIYDISVSLTLPLYRGGRIERGIAIAELKKSAEEDRLKFTKSEIVYNVTSLYYKLGQLERLLASTEAMVNSLERHKTDAAAALSAGTIPKADLLKTEVELAHARQNALLVRNAIESSYGLLKTLAGVDLKGRLVLKEPAAMAENVSVDESTRQAIATRADLREAKKRKEMAGEKVRLAEGRKLPQVNLNAEYGDKAGEDFGFEENWSVGLRVSLPLFDGGLINAETGRERMLRDSAEAQERALKDEIEREVRDAVLAIENARERLEAALTAVESAKENLRIERLKFEAGSGTTTEVIDAETAMLRAETDYHQALFDRALARASLARATGDWAKKEEHFK